MWQAKQDNSSSMDAARENAGRVKPCTWVVVVVVCRDRESVFARLFNVSLTIVSLEITCLSSVNGKWVRPCTALVPADASSTEDYVIVVKEVKSLTKSSGKFFSIRSFLMGFWNNLLGMVGFVKSRRDAKRSWSERKEYEELIKLKALEKKRLRALQQQQGLKP